MPRSDEHNRAIKWTGDAMEWYDELLLLLIDSTGESGSDIEASLNSTASGT